MPTAQTDIATIAEWLAAASCLKKGPLGKDMIAFGPYASLLGVDPATADYPDISILAEGGLALFVPAAQIVKSTVPHLEMKPQGHPPLAERIRHMFSHKLGVELPDVLTLALTAPDQSINAALAEEGLADIDLDAVAVLAVPLWAIPGSDRALVARLCKYP